MLFLRYEKQTYTCCFSFAAISCGRRDVETIRVEAQKIIDNIEAPTFRDVDYYVDAPADGVTDVREAIQAAIDQCSYENGGRVILRPGKYFSRVRLS